MQATHHLTSFLVFAVTYFAFMTFVILIAACDDQEWIKGGIEYSSGRRLSQRDISLNALSGPESSVLYGEAGPAARGSLGESAKLGATQNTMYFSLGLSYATTSGNWPASSGKSIQRICSTAIGPYIRNWNAGTSSSSAQSGLNPIKLQVFQDTLGLLGFAAAIQVLSVQLSSNASMYFSTGSTCPSI